MERRTEDPGQPDTNLRLAYDRTQLANERTYAAWLRTGLGIAAFGLALGQLPGRRLPVERWIGAGLVLLGAAVVLYGGWRFVQVARGLREGEHGGGPLAPAAGLGLHPAAGGDDRRALLRPLTRGAGGAPFSPCRRGFGRSAGREAGGGE